MPASPSRVGKWKADNESCTITVHGKNANVNVLVSQLCPTLCDPLDCSLSASSVHGISQARMYLVHIFDCTGSSLLFVGFLVAASGGYYLDVVLGLLIAVASLVAEQIPGLQGSVVVVHGLSCPAACGIFPDQGLNQCPLHWQADS